MLKVHKAENTDQLNLFINSFMNKANGWAVMQPDCGQVTYPAQFVVVTDPKISLATIQFLN